MINKDLDLLLLSKLITPSSGDLILPITLKNNKLVKFINSNCGLDCQEDFEDINFSNYKLILFFNGGLNVAKVVLYSVDMTSLSRYYSLPGNISPNHFREYMDNHEGRSMIYVSTPFSNIILDVLTKDQVNSLLYRLDQSITIVNNPIISNLRNTLLDLSDIMLTNQLNEISINSLAEYCVLDLIKDSSLDNNKKVEKLLKMIYE